MTPTAADSRSESSGRTNPSIPDALQRLEQSIESKSVPSFSNLEFEVVGDELRRLHACVRAHHAAGYLVGAGGPQPQIPPELAEESQRLRNEHPHLIGLVDWLIRQVDSIADQSSEDHEIFVLRLRELTAVLRRHEAEEERLLQLALWNVTGGEG